MDCWLVERRQKKPDLASQTEQSIEVLQVTGQSVTVEVQENTPKAPPPPVMGKIAAPVHPKATDIEMGEVEMLQTDHGAAKSTGG